MNELFILNPQELKSKLKPTKTVTNKGPLMIQADHLVEWIIQQLQLFSIMKLIPINNNSLKILLACFRSSLLLKKIIKRCNLLI